MSLFTAKNNSPNNLVKISLLTAFLSLAVLALSLGKSLNFKQTTKQANSNENTVTTNSLEVSPKPKFSWEKYINPEFGYTLLYPGLLVRHEIKDSETYLHFIRFDESSFSVGTSQKGVAVGVSDRSLIAEVNKIKEALTTDGGELIVETETLLLGEEAIRLDFEPKNPSISEQRTVVVVAKRGKTFSISSVPEQIDQILAGFTFLN